MANPGFVPVKRDSQAVVAIAALKAYSAQGLMPFGEEWIFAYRHPDGFQQPITGAEACDMGYKILANLRGALL